MVRRGMRGAKRPAAVKKRPVAAMGQRNGRERLSKQEKQRLAQLVVCAMAFAALVGAKCFLPERMGRMNGVLSQALERNMDVETVFSAVGRAISDGGDLRRTAEEVYQAVFSPEEGGSVETGAEVSLEAEGAMEELRQGLENSDAAAASEEETEASAEEEGPSDDEAAEEPQTASLAYVLYSGQNLPDHVSMEQMILGFDYTSPLSAPVSSSFGYREHPLEGEERFHYGLDLAADKGTAFCSFADGTVKAVGESSSYGNYCIVEHAGGCTTLYAHCDKISVSSGAQVRKGQTLGAVGQTGMATGPHLHFEVQKDGTYLNPIYYVDQSR